MKNKPVEYKITALEGADAIRKTSGMYVGSTQNGQALHHILMEVIDNSVDEYLAGYCDNILVRLHEDGSVSVWDNGRGIPTYYMPDKGKSALEVVFCTLHAGGKFDESGGYKMSGGLHGVGASTCCALSSRLRVVVRKGGKEYTMAFERGKKVEDLSEKRIRSKESGTFIRFAPDLTIFKVVTEFDTDVIERKLLELSFLCQGLNIEFIDEKAKKTSVFGSENSILGFVKHIAPNELIDDPITFTGEKNGIVVDIGLQWTCESNEETSKYFTNNIPNPDGGSHMVGFRSALTRTINTYINNSDLPKTFKIQLSGDDVREGLVSIISIRHPNPKFSSQTKEKLVSEDARTVIDGIVSKCMMNYFEQNPITAKKIVTQCVNTYKAREAARKARETTKKASIVDGGGVLPGKLADCSSKDPEKCELFICEGASAGGSMKMARNREFQAVLPLRGKVLNIERCEFQKLLKNEEITNIIVALGIGVGRNLDISKLRYGKIILNMDADVDGSHIRALMLTFLFRQMPQLIIDGRIYVARTPLYRVDYRGDTYYLQDDRDKELFIKRRNLSTNKLRVQRFKGLGEMSADQLWDTSMNPETRMISKVIVNNYVEADRIFSILMGDQVEPRKKFITESAQFARLDI